MWRTRVGYAGGTAHAPTYRRIGDHTEVFEVDFDPATLTYEELLDTFFLSHSATGVPVSVQYRSVILYRDEAQRMSAEVAKARLEELLGQPILTSIEPLDVFYPAEDYHQKYGLRSDRMLMDEFAAMYSNAAALRDSTAAARVNGYLYCGGPLRLLEREVSEYGLSDSAREHLRQRAIRGA